MAHIPGHVGPMMPPALPGAPGTRFNWGKIASSAMSLAGGLYGNYQARKEAKRNRRFTEDMSSTAYQRAAKDLEAAGLNRILALGGPASTPTGNMAAQRDPITPGVHTALSAALNKATIENINARTRLTDAQRRVLGPAASVGAGLETVIDRGKDEITTLGRPGTSLHTSAKGQANRIGAAKLTNKQQNRQNLSEIGSQLNLQEKTFDPKLTENQNVTAWAAAYKRQYGKAPSRILLLRTAQDIRSMLKANRKGR